MTGFELVLSGFVPLELPLDPSQAVRPRAHQVSLGILEIILIKFQLRLRQVQLLL